MKKITLCLVPYALCLALCACGGTKVVDLEDQDEVAEMTDVMELEYRDWTKTAEKMTNSMLKSGAFAEIKKPVIAMGPMTNDTLQRFDTDIMTKKIRTTLVNSGRAQIATSFQNKTVSATGYVPVKAELNAMSANGKNTSTIKAKAEGYAAVEYEKPASEDDTTHQVRAQRGNAEYDAGTVADKGTLVAPNMSLSGKMMQRNLGLETCWLCAKKERVEYYLQLTLTDVRSGLSVWEDEQPIIKEGKNAPKW
ncbi:MAG: penicillin-binding protein activator LpoB [Rickettsiales bacterium]|jgi:PBP1b-binding outer membrane lipoprotein LpoB|nr:penicillin-binding protein activator LpoB [Rickettsiales bacterium]